MDNPFYKPGRSALPLRPPNTRFVPTLPMPALLHEIKRQAWRTVQCSCLVLLLANQAEQANAQTSKPRATPLAAAGAVKPKGPQPVIVTGQRLAGRPDLDTVIEGDAQLSRGDTLIRADRLEYYQPDDQARAIGNVYVSRGGNVYEGPLLELKLESFEGFFTQPRYSFSVNDSHGEAQRIDFLGENRTVIREASLTTCARQPGPGWLPDWIMRAATIRIDNEEETGTAEGAVLSFKQLPLLPVPYLSFPLTERRKSGLLPPTPGLDNVNGIELMLPYYWNIAPNRDATLTTTLMSKRGANLGSEFRYLEQDYGGQLRLEVLPDDPLRSMTRWGFTGSHRGSLPRPWGGDAMALNLSVNRVSDDNYWRDFTRSNVSLTQRLLANDATLSWSQSGFSNSLRTLQWQTLQDVSSPIVPPYNRLPQLATRYLLGDVRGFDMSLEADYTRFDADQRLTLQPNAHRGFAAVQLSRPWLLPGGFVTPKFQLHGTGYQFDAALPGGAASASTASRLVPTLSIDSGLVFERDTQLWGRGLRQTLEPRAFYVNTPYRDQSQLPNYDSGANDFSFATIFAENAFVGNDRISDSHLLTLGVTSRLLDPTSGAEFMRFGLAQRQRFEDQKVTLPGGTAVSDRLSDLLLGTTVTWDPRWTFDTALQFNAKTELAVRGTAGVRYNPGLYRVISAAYRYQRDINEQFDVGWQWPVNDLWGDRGEDLGPGRGQGGGRWYSVGRLNYSLNENRLVKTVLGLEYDACCWLGRLALERIQTSSTSANERIMFQLEFVGFTRLGTNPLQVLKTNIPGYQLLRE